MSLYGTVVENEGAFCNKGKPQTKGHFVAKAILEKNGAQQPHSIAPSL